MIKKFIPALVMADALTTFGAGAVAADPALVLGHKKPDTDSVVGALSVAHLLKARGIDAVGVAQGKLNPETAYVFKRFGLQAPPVVESVAGKNVYLVDFAELGQAPDDFKSAKLMGIVDHHKLGDVSSEVPIEVWMMPLGSANTVAKQMYDFYGVEIPKELAGPMLSAIISDTVILQSPTTTEKDRQAVKELAEKAGVKDIKELGMEMFKAKSNLTAPARELVTRDYKEYDMGGKKVCIGQLELVSLDLVSPQLKADLIKEMEAMQKEGRHTMVLMLTDIMKKGTEMLIVSPDKAEVAKLLKADDKNWANGVMSRKKQVVPPLQGFYGKK